MSRRVLIAAALLVVAGAGMLVLAQRGFSARATPGLAETVIAQTIRRISVPARYKALRNPVDCSPQVFTEAGAHWADHCATCHDNNGDGESMLGKGMYPKPPDMRLGTTQGQSDGELYYTINNGVRLTGMPAFGEAGDNDMASWKLVCFIRHLPTLSSDEIDTLKSLNPRTPDEYEEERQEREFLNGGALPAPTSNGAHRH